MPPPEEEVPEGTGEEKTEETEVSEEKSDEKLDAIMEKLEGLVNVVQQQGERIDLVSDGMFSEDNLDRAAGRGEEKPEKKTEEVDYEGMEQGEFRKQIMKEINDVLKETGMTHAQATDHLAARVQIQEAIGRISEGHGEEGDKGYHPGMSYKAARKEFFANKDEILKTLNKFDGMSAYDAYDYVVKGKSPPEKKEEKSEEKKAEPKITDKGVKPGGKGKTDLEEKAYGTTKEAVGAKYDEIFGEDTETRPTSE